ncbi:hypothetical protein FB45DRAFT_1064586 [Roridomyces roridus]|uniref:F-box domain-containing protein n=1 Tax=Roridomyces roridus TaxID=1738132 RepID=A0AAD7BAH5_9AGAR|nr:hypothetical protein FB45DRAFT_1064586 [Roridomyces roridus]
MDFSDVPPEILCHILLLSDPQTVLMCSSVSRQWHDTIAGCPELQYELELWRSGLALAKHRRAWQKLDWTSKTVVELASLSGHKGRELAAGVFAFQQDGSDIHSFSLQENAHPCVETHALGIDPDAEVCLTIDPTQDLLALLYSPQPGAESFSLMLQTLSVAQPHPMARHSTITVESDLWVGRPRAIHIADDVVGVSFGYPGTVRVWNWHTGVLLADVRVHTDEPGFQFISPRAFVTASTTHSGWIDLFVITPFAKAPDSEGAVHVARLRFPELARMSPRMLQAIEIYSGPLCGTPIRRSFSHRNDSRIYLFLIQLESDEDETRYLRLIIHHRTLVGYVSQYEREGRTESIDLQWESWGPRNTRILAGDQFDWVANAHGERIACRDIEGMQVQVLDFGVIPGDPSNGYNEDGTMVLEPSTIGAPFKDPVTTHLPFRRTLLDPVLDPDDYFNAILMDEQHIVVTDEETDKMTVFKF